MSLREKSLMDSRSRVNRTEPRILREYERGKVVVVHKTTDCFGGLSNMAPGFPLLINGVKISTTEALYQACRYPHFPAVQEEIIAQHSPMTAKMKSKRHRKKTRPDWYEVRHNVMRWCLRAKLAQNYEEFSRLLLATCDRPIVELSRRDDYWGAKLVDESGDTLMGQNVLGRLLMELREELKADSEGVLKTVPPLKIPNFLLHGKPIETVTAEGTGNGRNSQYTLF